MSSPEGTADAFEVSCKGRPLVSLDVALDIPSPDVRDVHPELPGNEHARFSIRAPFDPGVIRADDDWAIAVTPVFKGRKGTTLSCRTPRIDPERAKWFDEHYGYAASEIIEFLSAAGVSMAGRLVADVGSGDGIIDLGVAHRAGPALLACFDIVPTPIDHLRAEAARYAPDKTIPDCLEFRSCTPTTLPAADGTFDVVFSWSAFEHIADPVAVLREIRRVLRPDGTFMLQLWPFFHSSQGSHLWPWFPEDGFVQLLRDTASIEAAVRAAPGPDPADAERMLVEYGRLNRITLDELHRAVLVAGLRVTKVQLITETVDVPPPLAHYPLGLLAISGVKLLAVPAS